jgi:hypothetical protein
MHYWYNAGHFPDLRDGLTFVHTFLDFSRDSSSCFCSGCRSCKNCSLDFCVSFSVGSSRVDLVDEEVSAKETVNSCRIAAASSVVAIGIANKHGAEHRRHPLCLHGHHIHLFWAVVIDIYCLVGHAGVNLHELMEVAVGLI